MGQTDHSDEELYGRVREHLARSILVKQRMIGSAAAGEPFSIRTAAVFSNDTLAAVSRGGEETVQLGTIVEAARVISQSFRNGGKLLLCGNGGSAADCQHMAAEFTNVLDRSFERGPLPAVALTTDTSFLTSFVNDSHRFAEIFSRQVEALGRRGDTLIGISTSGSSENVIQAVKKARAMGLATIALSGASGPLADAAGIAIRVPSTKTSHIQEAHLAVEHAICDLVEHMLFERPRHPSVS